MRPVSVSDVGRNFPQSCVYPRRMSVTIHTLSVGRLEPFPRFMSVTIRILSAEKTAVL